MCETQVQYFTLGVDNCVFYRKLFMYLKPNEINKGSPQSSALFCISVRYLNPCTVKYPPAYNTIYVNRGEWVATSDWLIYRRIEFCHIELKLAWNIAPNSRHYNKSKVKIWMQIKKVMLFGKLPKPSSLAVVQSMYTYYTYT